ncbi:electron transfer flavoprotein subunit beta/FixA family protein [Corynebacterium glucuronolyticum]|uniref:Electron transfer flavoprotein subunit beta n=1 Tax=Corynebacterium glucuronolyticum TaxID=39791 RepID=A0A7T4EEM5_9CORY|nr:electron transfer flavoprotein subunit beta/FixA family protein [Corynebacterium glucuronolyticum]QQB45942.1 electron transfer flavoprotein subunit beta/FixA family protein [Corynebacterium glucuronolyticum]WKD63336.1 Electron transfer flavoprotein subunit beta [Corynebacterium glucuronolyticum DSM 44120]SMB80142.1 electron transfer flavoprotein beta subunit [Corynebacterium glucuronolyticum]
MPAIAVLVKHVPDTWSEKSLESDFTLQREGVDEVLDEVNEFAVEQALRLKDQLEGAEVVAVSVGPDRSTEALRKAIAMGCDRAILVSDEAIAGADALGTTWVLTNALNTINDPKLIVCGSGSSDGAMGVIPGLLSEYRQIPALTYCVESSIEGDKLKAKRVTNAGETVLSSSLPAILSITDKAASPRFPNFKSLAAAKKAEIPTLTLADLGVEPTQVGLNYSATVVQSAEVHPPREQGEIIFDHGQGAAAIADYLEKENLI